MSTILKPCAVPWAVSPSGGGIGLTHIQDDEPECRVLLGGGRIKRDGGIDNRRIELTFENVLWTRTGPHPDNVNVESIGYEIDNGFADKGYSGSGDVAEKVDWIHAYWLREGICPDPKFYYASESDWLMSLNVPGDGFKHYVIDDRDGYVELISTGYSWKEWLWIEGHINDVPTNSDVAFSGVGKA